MTTEFVLAAPELESDAWHGPSGLGSFPPAPALQRARGGEGRRPRLPTPFLRPSPPRLSELGPELALLEASGIYSNYGPINERFERRLVDRLFSGIGSCVTVSNATTGLILAIKRSVLRSPGRGRLALMPSFTFAATAHAALWAGLTPLLCDIDPVTWMPDPADEERLLEQHGDEIAVVVPYATFGASLDLARYDALSRHYGVGVVVDAAASLGSEDAGGRGFGTCSRHPVVYSMHATKTFATGEAGVVYCADPAIVEDLRAMGNFGFSEPRTAMMPGLNAKLSEVGALLALKRLETIETVLAARDALATAYRSILPAHLFQASPGRRQAHQFMPVVLPSGGAAERDRVVAAMGAAGIGCGTYFSPHLAQQPYFTGTCLAGPLPVTEAIAARSISLPMSDSMSVEEVAHVAQSLCEIARLEPLGPGARGEGWPGERVPRHAPSSLRRQVG